MLKFLHFHFGTFMHFHTSIYKYEYSKDLQLEKLICRKYELTDAEIRLIYDEMNRLPDLGAVNNMKVEVDVNV